MFTAVEVEWLKAFLENYIIKGEYKYYVAYTIDNTSSSYQSNSYDFMVLISNEEITKNGLSYSTQGNFQLVKVDSSGASSNYYEPRYVIETGIGKSVTVNNYNHVFSNVEEDIVADVIAYEQVIYNHYLQQMETNYIYMLFIGGLLCLNILNKVFSSTFPMKIGD